MFGSTRFVSFAVFMVVSAAPVSAQSDAIVRGRITATSDGAPLSGVTVTLTPSARSEPSLAATDAEGRFAFSQVVPNDYVLSAAIPGFESRTVRLTLKPREVRAISLSLDIARVNVEVSVTADGPAAASTHSPSSTVLTAERIDSVPTFQRLDLPDAILTSAPGMIRGHDDFVHVRGHEIALNPIINGISFWENPHVVFSASLGPDIVESANVMTGGFPAEYGNRFGGVVDIVTKSGLRLDHRGSVTFSAGEAGRRRVGGDVGGRRAGLGYYVFGTAFESDRFLSPPDPLAIHDAARGGHLFARLDADAARHGSFNLIIMGDGLNAEIPKTPTDVELRPLANAEQRNRQQTLTAGWSRSWARSALNASVYQRWSRLRLLPAAGPLTARADVTRELRTLGVKADVVRLSGRHSLKFGIDGVSLRPREDLDYNYGGYRELTHLLGLPHLHVVDQRIAFSGREAGGQVSGFAQDNIQLGSRIVLDAGVRVDRYALVVTETHVSPRLNLAFLAGRGAVLHASYNHFFVPPAIEGVLSSSAGLTSRIQEIGTALPALNATSEDQFELGGSTPLGPLQIAVTGYFRATDNPVHTAVWPDARIYSYASFDRARAYGLEARADVPGLARRGVTAYVNYALGRVNFYNPVTGGFVTEAEHLTAANRFLAPMDQTHTLTGGATYRHQPTGIWGGLSMEYGSGTPTGHGGSHEHGAGEEEHADAAASPESGRVPDHFTTGVSLGIDVLRSASRRPRLSLRLDVENLSNRVYLIARDSQFSPSQYSIPRLISLTARVQF